MSDLNALWTSLVENRSSSLLKEVLTPDLYKELKNKKTKLGATLADVIRSGCLNLDSIIGVYSCDSEGYDVFRPLLYPILCEYHKVKEVNHPRCDFGDLGDLQFPDLHEAGESIISTRIRVGRSLVGFPFPPLLSNDQRKEIERLTVDALNTLGGEYAGKYYSVDTLSDDEYQQLVDDHLMYRNDNHTLRGAGGYIGWPVGRGIYMNNDRTFLVWLNEGDHLRFISMQKGCDVRVVHKRLAVAMKTLKEKLNFGHDDKFGYLGNCPSNIGTCLRASVLIKIPNLDQNKEVLNTICNEYNLQLRGVNGEHTESIDGVYDISNKRRLGLTEYDAVYEMCTGIHMIIKAEKQLGSNHSATE